MVDITTWRHRDEDDVWAERTLELLRVHAPARAAGLEGQRARFRVRPDEMAFATTSLTVPVDFDAAVVGFAHVRTALLNGRSAVLMRRPCHDPRSRWPRRAAAGAAAVTAAEGTFMDPSDNTLYHRPSDDLPEHGRDEASGSERARCG